MDPHANIREQVELAHEILTVGGGTYADPEAVVVVADRLAELVLALDEWRRKGGFDPYTT